MCSGYPSVGLGWGAEAYIARANPSHHVATVTPWEDVLRPAGLGRNRMDLLDWRVA